MIKKSFAAVGHAARDLFKKPGALLLLAALYFATLACVYYFFATGVATGGQLAVSALTALFAPLLFFALQAAVAHLARGAGGAGALARAALRDFWKVLLVSLPLVLLGVAVYYLLGWLETRFPKPDPGAAPPVVYAPRTAAPPPLRWQDVLLSALGLLAYGFALPLLAARLWLAVAGEGLKATIRKYHRVAASAFAARSVLVYTLGVVFFGLMPYFVVRTVTPLENGWAELFVFGLRLALAFALTLGGWAVTLAALAAVAPPPEAAPADAPAEQPDKLEAQAQPARA